MESLLSLSFDNISSRDGQKIRKGLRQIEGLLAQICLSKASSRSPHKRKSSALELDRKQNVTKQLGELRHDPAFREFFRLQEGFQWNVASRLVQTLETLMGMGNPSETDLLILQALDLLQGILMLHPPSKCLFSRESHMNLLLDLLDSMNPPKIQSQTLLVLVAALLDMPRNTRTFESIDGLLTVTSLFKSRSTTKEVKMRSLEFLYFYLMPEAAISQALMSASAPNTAVLQRGTDMKSFTALACHARTHSGDAMDIDDEEDMDIRSTEDKQMMLGQYLSNVEELVQDLHESGPFGGVGPV
ncbi:Cell division control protein 14 [Pseudocercospora fuligena]|uniref:Cell division control protein 14 n=1 Tax=Pseudocercospora fuligena TaxID=685502 RepID=A0A8H6R7M3_9PEZI|nr:Cell division control protein 14 [Pseudocercospora fuligena]